jgi:iron complex transport system substrate-binding protein
MLYQVAAMVGEAEQGLQRIAAMQADLRAMQAAVAARVAAGARRPKVFFEEWDTPHISAIRWVSELMAIAGGNDCFAELSLESLGKNRIIADGAEIVRRNPDIILGSWCGKKFRPENVVAREGWGAVNAVRDAQLFEIKSPDILQPGPAALTDGVAKMHQIILRWMDSNMGIAESGA